MSTQQPSLETLHTIFKSASDAFDKYLSGLNGKHANSWTAEELEGFDLVNNELLQAHHELNFYAHQSSKSN